MTCLNRDLVECIDRVIVRQWMSAVIWVIAIFWCRLKNETANSTENCLHLSAPFTLSLSLSLPLVLPPLVLATSGEPKRIVLLSKCYNVRHKCLQRTSWIIALHVYDPWSSTMQQQHATHYTTSLLMPLCWCNALLYVKTATINFIYVLFILIMPDEKCLWWVRAHYQYSLTTCSSSCINWIEFS